MHKFTNLNYKDDLAKFDFNSSELIQFFNQNPKNLNTLKRKILDNTNGENMKKVPLDTNTKSPSSYQHTSGYHNLKINQTKKTKSDSIVNKNMEKIRFRLKNMSEEKKFNQLDQVLNDVWATRDVDYSRLMKGRSEEETRTVLNYMILALYQKNIQEKYQFDTNKYFDQVTYLFKIR